METQGFNSDDTYGFYLISLKWSKLQDTYVTFVRKGAFAYCYNLNWAGAFGKFELNKLNEVGKTIAVHHSVFKPFLIKVNDDYCNGYALPNTPEIRRIIGFKE